MAAKRLPPLAWRAMNYVHRCWLRLGRWPTVEEMLADDAAASIGWLDDPQGMVATFSARTGRRVATAAVAGPNPEHDPTVCRVRFTRRGARWVERDQANLLLRQVHSGFGRRPASGWRRSDRDALAVLLDAGLIVAVDGAGAEVPPPAGASPGVLAGRAGFRAEITRAGRRVLAVER